MKVVSKEELLKKIEDYKAENHNENDKLDMSRCRFENIDLSDTEMKNINFEWSDFMDVNLEGADFEGSILSNAYMERLSLKGASFKNCVMHGVNMRFSDITGVNMEGADIFGTNLEEATIKDVKTDEKTKHFNMICPETGPVIGWKTCFNMRLVMLLIPEGARITNSTLNTCRCDKAKVLKVTSPDESLKFDEARSFVDGDFVYKTGEMAYAKGFNPDRWRDSTGGIHFFLKKEEALGYLMSISEEQCESAAAWEDPN